MSVDARFPHGNVDRGLALVVAQLGADAGLDQDARQLALVHGGGDVERRVSVLVPPRHARAPRHQDPRHPRVPVPRRRVQRGVAVLK